MKIFVKTESAEYEHRRLCSYCLRPPQTMHVCIKTIVVDKKECEPSDELSLSTKLVKKLAFFIKENYAYFSDFVTINIYYDGGQKELAQIIHNTFQSLLSNVRFRRIIPDDYKLQLIVKTLMLYTL